LTLLRPFGDDRILLLLCARARPFFATFLFVFYLFCAFSFVEAAGFFFSFFMQEENFFSHGLFDGFDIVGRFLSPVFLVFV